MDCEICLEKYDKIDRKPMTIIPCGHTYCADCLSKLKRQVYKCPKCKQPISSKKPSYAVLSILDLNLVVDMNSDLKQSINESLRELKEFKARLSVSCEQKIHESQSKINLIKEEINNKTSQLMNILICNQEILFNEADNLQKSLSQNVKKIISEQEIEIRANEVNQLDRNGLLSLKEELIKIKIDLNQRLQRLNEIDNNYEFRPNENLNNQMNNLIGGIFKKNFLSQKSILLPDITENSSNPNRASLTANRILISGSGDKTIRFWNIETGELLNTFEEHDDRIECVQCVSDDTLVSASMDQTIKVWNIRENKCINTLEGHISSVSCLLVLTGDIIASGSMDQTIKIWNIRTGDCLNTLESHRSSIWCLTSINDLLISGSGDKSIKLWDLKTHKCINTLTGHTNIVSSLQVVNDILISGSSDKTIKIWNIETGECLNTLKGHKSSVLCLQILNNDLIISGSMDQTIKVWNIRSGLCLNTFEAMSGIKCIQVLSSDQIISGAFDHLIKVWNIKTGLCVRTFTGHISDVNSLQIALNYVNTSNNNNINNNSNNTQN